MRRDLPSGPVKLRFTDIEGSPRLVEKLGDSYGDLLAEHRGALREAVGRQGGVEVDTQGDGFLFVFSGARRALGAARAGQAALRRLGVAVRMGIHTGEPRLGDEGYVGIDVHRAARICAAAHGGQVVISEATRLALADDPGRDLGMHRLKDLGAPERLFQLGTDDFPPLRALNVTNLPTPPDALIGRSQEVGEVVDRIASARIVTLTGAGGSGKTRLALQAAMDTVDR